MYHVKTVVRPSSISGLGLFADEDIPKGKLVWEYHPTTSIFYTKAEVLSLLETDLSRLKELLESGFYVKSLDGYVICTDNARYSNHSESPNIEGKSWNNRFAIRDIKIGEEITESYSFFDQCPWTKDLEEEFNVWWP